MIKFIEKRPLKPPKSSQMAKLTIIFKNFQGKFFPGWVRKNIFQRHGWSDIVQKNSGSTTSVKNVQKAVKSVVDKNDRSKNFIVYDNDCDEDQDEDIISEIMGVIYEDERKPQILGFNRIGIRKPDIKRPLKVTLVSRDAVIEVLSNAKQLKNSRYKDVYLVPDRSYEERAAHKKLVAQMKLLFVTDPNKHHYIRDSRIISVNKLHRSE